LLEKAGMNKEQLKEGMEVDAQETLKDIMEKIERKEKSKMQRKINDSKYNETYKNILTEELPKYLKGRRKRKDRSLIAKYRCGNEIKGDQYWRKEEDRRCRICWHAEEIIRHVLKECEMTRSGLEIEELGGSR